MDERLVERIKTDMSYEFARSAPPDGFPHFHDISTARHTSDEFYELEQQYLWPNTWVIAGRAEDVANAGDYFTFTDLGVPLLVVRGSDGAIRCFYNTCQHRGAPVVREPRGSAKRLRCQYHSWTYDIDDGALISVPDERDFVDLDWELRCLPEASCDSFAGFVFVNRNPEARPLRDWLGPAAEMLAPFQVYHFRHIHSHDGVSVLDNRGAAMGLYPNGHSRMVTPFSRQNIDRVGMNSWDDWKHLDHGPFRTIETVPAMVDCTSTAVSLFPNAIIPLGAIGFPINLFWPIDRHTTRLDWIYYAPPIDGTDRFTPDDLPEHWVRRRQQYNQIMAEDELNMAPMQTSMESPALRGIPINYQERRIWHLHEEIDRVIGAERIPPELRLEQVLGPYVVQP
jgi:phenylpropionate dioxygenase-like ring-hydroxylating dioxygenase large terminal subunit